MISPLASYPARPPFAQAEASKRIDMTAHKDHYPPNTNLSVNLIGAQRMYELLDGRR